MMEEEIGQPVIYRGRFRGRKLWMLVGAALLAVTLALALIWTIPSRRADEGRTAPAGEREAEAGQGGGDIKRSDTEEGAQSGGGLEPAPQAGGGAPALTPGEGGSAPGLVIEFPDPSAGAPDTPPPGGYQDIRGHWVLDMAGTAYGLSNCHIFLEDNGTIAVPDEYKQAFEVSASSYQWEPRGASFTATLQVIVKMAYNQAFVPVLIEFRGNVSDALREITGEFMATPQGELYSPYAQQGTFGMRR